MKELRTLLTLLIVALAAAVALALAIAAWSAVRGHYEYETLVAPRSLHLMVLEMEAEESRASTWLFGAGLAGLAVVVLGGTILVMRDGAELLRQRRLGKKRSRQQPARAVQVARQAPLLGDGHGYEGDNSDSA